MYKVLYRKYRPRVFADVVGQPQVTVTLKNELMRGRISHAYLFTGSRGTGKTGPSTACARWTATPAGSARYAGGLRTAPYWT